MDVRNDGLNPIFQALQSSLATQTQTEPGEIGRGVSQQTGPTDETGQMAGAVALALAAFLPRVSGNFEARLADITGKLKEVSGEVNKERVLNEQESKRLNMKENQAMIEQSGQKLDEAKEQGEIGKIFTYIGIAAQALGAIAMAAAGVALIATGVGAAAGGAMLAIGGGLMIGAAALTVAALVNSVVQAETGAGVLGNTVKAIDPDADPNLVMGLDIAVAATLALATIAASVGAAVMTGGASSAGTAMAVVNFLTQAAGGASQVVSGGASIGSSASGIAAGVSTAEAKNLEADSKDIDAFMQELNDLIDQAMTILLDSSQRFNALMDSVSDMVKETGDTLSNTRMAV